MKKLFFIISIGLFLLPTTSLARNVISDWYIKDFYTEIVVNRDSSLTITENIIADCGNLPDKHGIFRIVPTKIKTPEKTIYTPVELIAITDFNGVPHKYSMLRGSGTITWKIGDPKKTVSGTNNYKIVYKIENAIRFDNSEFDELYWNLLGNFWEIEIDNFRAKIIFPDGINNKNSSVSAYSGEFGEKANDLTFYRWYTSNILEVFNAQILRPGQGVTVSVSFPKNILIPYKEKVNLSFLLSFILPIITLIVCYLIWKKHGRDPKINKTIIPEFEIPENLGPVQMGALIANGKFKNKFIPAAIINMAVKGYISIEEVKEKNLKSVLLFINTLSLKDFKIKKIKPEREFKVNLDKIELLISQKIFRGMDEVLLSDMRNDFYRHIPEIKKAVKKDLIDRDLIGKRGLSLQATFLIIGLVLFFLTFFIGFGVCGIIVLIFSFLMPKRTIKGTELNWRIKGFKLYMETAEKYRQQFNERENIFETFLPYAMIFGIAKLWTKKVKQIYGQEYFNNYHPAWLIGSGLASFNIDNFVSGIESISRNISASNGGSSGFGGGGFSGGGGGGGGGGGW